MGNHSQGPVRFTSIAHLEKPPRQQLQLFRAQPGFQTARIARYRRGPRKFLQGWLLLLRVLVSHTANLITLNPLAFFALQATTAALLDQASATKQYAQLGPIHLRARIRARSVLPENTAWKVALQLRVAGIVLREGTRLLAAAKRLLAILHRIPVFALRELSQLVAELTQAHRRRAPIALREGGLVLAAA